MFKSIETSPSSGVTDVAGISGVESDEGGTGLFVSWTLFVVMLELLEPPQAERKTAIENNEINLVLIIIFLLCLLILTLSYPYKTGVTLQSLSI